MALIAGAACSHGMRGGAGLPQLAGKGDHFGRRRRQVISHVVDRAGMRLADRGHHGAGNVFDMDARKTWPGRSMRRAVPAFTWSMALRPGP